MRERVASLRSPVEQQPYEQVSAAEQEVDQHQAASDAGVGTGAILPLGVERDVGFFDYHAVILSQQGLGIEKGCMTGVHPFVTVRSLKAGYPAVILL